MRLVMRGGLAILFVLTSMGLTMRAEVARAATDPCASPAQQIACENAKPGVSRSVWDPGSQMDPSIVGFADGFSFNVGETVNFKIQTDAAKYTVQIYRLGWYGGLGSRLVSTITPSVSLPQAQPACATDAALGLVDCGTWSVSATWNPPADAISGLYMARLWRTDTGRSNLVPFVVRNDASTSDVVVQTADTTWQAYNRWGGWSLYTSTTGGPRAYKVSYNRPIDTRTSCCSVDYVFGVDNATLRYFERNGYDVSYISGIDTDRRGAQLRQHKVFVSMAHDEYWSGAQRANVEAARDAGVHLMFLGGNDVYWRTRWEPSVDGRADSYRTLVTYKESFARAKIDPSPEWTGTWRDPRFTTAPNGSLPENALTGTIYKVDCCASAMTVPASQGKLRFWKNAPLATASGTTTLADQTLGYEWNVDEDNGYRPPGLVRLSTTTTNVQALLQDLGKATAPGTATHHMTLHRARSGALVFSAGSVQFAWGLDDGHDAPASPVDPNIQQAVINLLADMNVQPTTIMAGLTRGVASSDTIAPTASVTSAPASIAYGQPITVQGTASDNGGLVAGVEVSFDGGNRWYQASGTNAWSYTWFANRSGTAAVQVRAVDDSANLGPATPGPAITVACPCSMFDASQTPATPVANDTGAVEVGVKFQVAEAGTITGVRVWRGAANTGTHTGTLWSATGQVLAEATFPNNPTTGWQEVSFSAPVAVVPGTTYVASSYFPTGGYAATPEGLHFFDAAVPTAPVRALSSKAAGGNGLFRYGSHAFPTRTFDGANYWVDVAFMSGATPPAPTTTLTTTTTTTTTAPPSGTCPCTVFGTAVPPNASAADTAAIETGVKIRVSQPMQATGVRFYKGALNTGTHIGSLWSATGQRLATGTFTGETATGWQSLTFATPVNLDPNVTYVASVFMPNGGYAYNVRQFATTGAGSPPVQALASGVDGANGVFRYSASSVFPTSSFSATNYYVDITVADPVAPTTTTAAPVTTTTTTAPPATTTTAPPVTTTTAPPSTTTIFDNATPAVASATDTGSLTIGLKFRTDVAGVITGARFYKGPTNTGTHIGSLWTATGTRLATATFANETATGWQEVTFSSPVAVQANTTYVVSVQMPVGGYAFTLGAFSAAGAGAGPIKALANGIDGVNGVFAYSGAEAFPTRGFNATNYWVDARFRVGG